MQLPAFWARYLRGAHDGTHFGNASLAIAVDAGAPRVELHLQGDATFTALYVDGLWLGRDGGDEQYPPYPDALRCIEVEWLARAAALVEPALGHPGPVVALLAKLAPITTDEEARHWRPTLEQAFFAVGAEVPRTQYRFWDHAEVAAFDRRASKFRWIPIARGHVLVQAGKTRPDATIASLRVEGFARVWRGVAIADAVADHPELDGASFPHAPLASVLAAARATCHAAMANRSDRTRGLAAQVARGERGAKDVLADALDGVASEPLVAAVRAGHRWAAEVVAGVDPWQPIPT